MVSSSTDHDKRRYHPILIVTGVVAAALFAAAVVSEVVFHSSIDPTESTFAVTLHNDTPSAVVVKQCNAKCSSFRERDALAAGESVRVNASSDDVANWWLVSDNGDRTLGCLSLRHERKIDGLVVNVSERTACPT